jgi:hypothetical protein
MWNQAASSAKEDLPAPRDLQQFLAGNFPIRAFTRAASATNHST